MDDGWSRLTLYVMDRLDIRSLYCVFLPCHNCAASKYCTDVPNGIPLIPATFCCRATLELSKTTILAEQACLLLCISIRTKINCKYTMYKLQGLVCNLISSKIILVCNCN